MALGFGSALAEASFLAPLQSRFCTSCKAVLKSDQVYCMECGAKAAAPPKPARVCSKCGHVPGAIDKFCGRCGNSMAAPKPQPTTIRCRKCSKSTSVANIYCPSCGGKLRNSPVVTSRTEILTRILPFATVYRTDADLQPGERRVEQEGVTGAERLTYAVTMRDGKEIGRKVVSRQVVRAPVAQIVAVGAKQ